MNAIAACPYAVGGTAGAICGPEARPPMISIDRISTALHHRMRGLRPTRSMMRKPAITPRTSMMSICWKYWFRTILWWNSGGQVTYDDSDQKLREISLSINARQRRLVYVLDWLVEDLLL